MAAKPASLALFCVLAFVSIAQGLNTSINLYLNDKYFYRFYSDSSAPRFQYDVTLSHDLVRDLNLAFTLWGSEKIVARNGGFSVPEELDYQIFLTFNAGDWSFALDGSVYAKTALTRYEVGFSADYYVPAPIDLINLTVGAACYYDMRGLYQEVKLEPGLSIPLGKGISVSVPAVLGLAERHFNRLPDNGVTGISLNPKITLILSDAISLSLNGGYFFAVLGGLKSFAHGGVKASFRFSA